MTSRLVYTTETPSRPVKGSVYCKHGKDAGQTCYPCEIGDDLSSE